MSHRDSMGEMDRYTGGAFGDTALIAGDLFSQAIPVLGNIAIAIVILLVGLFLASLLSKLVARIVRSLKADELLERVGMDDATDKIGFKLVPSKILAWFVKWFIIITTFLVVSSRLGLEAVSDFLVDILGYIPNVLVAVVIFVIGSMAASAAHTAVTRALENAPNVGNKAMVASIAKYAILFVTTMAALTQLGIGGHLIEILFTGIILALSLGLGIAFGLGGRDRAKEMIDRIGR